MELRIVPQVYAEALSAAENYLFLPVFNKTYQIRVINTQDKSKGFHIEKSKEEVTITIGKKNSFFEALLALNIQDEEEILDIHESMMFKEIGAMMDCARNAAMNLEEIRKMIVYLAFIGYDHLQLYFEDVLQLDKESMFGYMRGSYQQQELQMIDSFADQFGIEIIPSIQSLAHYNQIFRWQEYQQLNDIDDVLLVGSEAVYHLLEKVISMMRKCFRSHKININMDEAYNLGRGKYLDEHGYQKSYEILLKHKEKVVEICQKYQFYPMMWSDMFFRNFNQRKYYAEMEKLDFNGLKIQDVSLIYWDYYHLNKQEYDHMISLHKQLSDDLIFAGGIWLWRGFVPHQKYTESTMFPAIDACKEHNVNNLFFTIWGDNGGECLKNYSLGSLITLHEYCCNEYSLQKLNQKFQSLLGYTYKEWIKLDRPNFYHRQDMGKYNSNPTKYLLYMDPLLSLFDGQINPDYPSFYENQQKVLHHLAAKDSPFSYLFELESKLCRVLKYKSCLNVNIKYAYDQKDDSLMKQCYQEVKMCIKALKDFICYYRTCWKKENKMTGFEVLDIRLGGVLSRLEYTKNLLNDYLKKEISVIEELEIERKNILYKYQTRHHETMVNDYMQIASANRF